MSDTPNRRSDYTVPGVSKPAAPKPAPAGMPGDMIDEFDPEQYLRSPQQTPEEQQRVADSLKELNEIGNAEVAPRWDPPAEPAQAVAAPVDVPTPAMLYCPCCGFDLKKSPEDISLDDKREFLRSVLANRSFTKTFKLFGGKASITFRARTTAVDNLIEKQLQLDIVNKRFVPAADPEWNRQYYMARISRLWLTSSLVSYKPSTLSELPEMCTPEALTRYGPDDDNNTHIGKAEAKLFLSMPIAVFSLINSTFMRFNAVMSRLAINAENPNFWTEIDGLT